MTQFEFLMMVAAVVIAIGISEIIAGWGKLLRANRELVEFDWLHISMTVMLLLTLVFYWVGMWAYQPLPIEIGVQIYFLVLPSFFMVVAAYAISPEPKDSVKLVCRDYYMAKRRAIWIPWVIGGVLSGLADGVIAGFEKLPLQMYIGMSISIGLCVAMAVSSRVWIHICFMLFVYSQIVIFMFSPLSQISLRFIEGGA